jgi:hypothetical protein
MEKQEILDWLDATADELADDLRRLRALRGRVNDGATLKRSDLEDLASVANNLDLDVASFQRRLPP